MLEVRRSVAKWGAWPKSTRGPGDTAQYPIAHPAAGMTAPPQLGAQQASAQTSHANTIPKFDLGELAAHLPEVATRIWGSPPDPAITNLQGIPSANKRPLRIWPVDIYTKTPTPTPGCLSCALPGRRGAMPARNLSHRCSNHSQPTLIGRPGKTCSLPGARQVSWLVYYICLCI